MPRNKSIGSILINSNSLISRQRFTIAHELCHLLHSKHKPLSVTGHSDGATFQCREQDMHVGGTGTRTALSSYQKQEQQANQFAAGLLMPKYKLKACLREAPNLEHIISLASDLKVSKETAAQRYVAMHDDNIAIVFSKNRIVRYWAKPACFPRVKVWNNGTLDHLGASIENKRLTCIDEAAPDDWLADMARGSLQVQTLFQDNGYAMTLLHLEGLDDDEDDGLEDSYERFSRF